MRTGLKGVLGAVMSVALSITGGGIVPLATPVANATLPKGFAWNDGYQIGKDQNDKNPGNLSGQVNSEVLVQKVSDEDANGRQKWTISWNNYDPMPWEPGIHAWPRSPWLTFALSYNLQMDSDINWTIEAVDHWRNALGRDLKSSFTTTAYDQRYTGGEVAGSVIADNQQRYLANNQAFLKYLRNGNWVRCLRDNNSPCNATSLETGSWNFRDGQRFGPFPYLDSSETGDKVFQTGGYVSAVQLFWGGPGTNDYGRATKVTATFTTKRNTSINVVAPNAAAGTMPNTWILGGYKSWYLGNPYIQSIHYKYLGAPVTDSDKDGITDFNEINTYGTDPYKPDTDGDGKADGNKAMPELNLSAGELGTKTGTGKTVDANIVERGQDGGLLDKNNNTTAYSSDPAVGKQAPVVLPATVKTTGNDPTHFTGYLNNLVANLPGTTQPAPKRYTVEVRKDGKRIASGISNPDGSFDLVAGRGLLAGGADYLNGIGNSYLLTNSSVTDGTKAVPYMETITGLSDTYNASDPTGWSIKVWSDGWDGRPIFTEGTELGWLTKPIHANNYDGSFLNPTVAYATTAINYNQKDGKLTDVLDENVIAVNLDLYAIDANNQRVPFSGAAPHLRMQDTKTWRGVRFVKQNSDGTYSNYDGFYPFTEVSRGVYRAYVTSAKQDSVDGNSDADFNITYTGSTSPVAIAGPAVTYQGVTYPGAPGGYFQHVEYHWSTILPDHAAIAVKSEPVKLKDGAAQIPANDVTITGYLQSNGGTDLSKPAKERSVWVAFPGVNGLVKMQLDGKGAVTYPGTLDISTNDRTIRVYSDQNGTKLIGEHEIAIQVPTPASVTITRQKNNQVVSSTDNNNQVLVTLKGADVSSIQPDQLVVTATDNRDLRAQVTRNPADNKEETNQATFLVDLGSVTAGDHAFKVAVGGKEAAEQVTFLAAVTPTTADYPSAAWDTAQAGGAAAPVYTGAPVPAQTVAIAGPNGAVVPDGTKVYVTVPGGTPVATTVSGGNIVIPEFTVAAGVANPQLTISNFADGSQPFSTVKFAPSNTPVAPTAAVQTNPTAAAPDVYVTVDAATPAGTKVEIKDKDGKVVGTANVTDPTKPVKVTLTSNNPAGPMTAYTKVGDKSSAGTPVTAAPVDASKSTVTVSPATTAVDNADGITVTVTLKDQYGNPVNGAAESLSATGGPTESVMFAQAAGDRTGTYTAKLTSEQVKSGNLQVKYLDTNIDAAKPWSFTAGAMTYGEWKLPANEVQAGTTFGARSVSVRVTDKFGNPVAQGTRVKISYPDPTNPTTTRTDGASVDANGWAQIAAATTFKKAQTYTYTVMPENSEAALLKPNSEDPATALLQVTPNMAEVTGTVTVDPGQATANGTDKIVTTVTLEDNFGNKVNEVANTLTLQGSPNDQASFSQAEGDTTGTYTVEFTSTTAREGTLTVKRNGVQVDEDQPPQPWAFNNGPAAKATWTPVDPTVTAGDPVALTATIIDKDGNNVTTQPRGQVKVAYPDPADPTQLKIETLDIGEDGTVSVQATYDTAGSYPVKVFAATTEDDAINDGSATAWDTSTVTVVPGVPDPASTATITPESGTKTADGQESFLITATLVDAKGNPITGAADKLQVTGDPAAKVSVDWTEKLDGEDKPTGEYEGKVTATQTASGYLQVQYQAQAGEPIDIGSALPVSFTTGTPAFGENKSKAAITSDTKPANGSTAHEITLTMKDENGDAVAVDTSKLSIKNVEDASTVSVGDITATERKGIYTAKVTATAADTYKFVAKYDNTVIPTGTEGNQLAAVFTQMVLDTATIYKAEDGVVKITVFDDQEVKAANTEVYIRVGDTDYLVTTDPNGEATQQLDPIPTENVSVGVYTAADGAGIKLATGTYKPASTKPEVSSAVKKQSGEVVITTDLDSGTRVTVNVNGNTYEASVGDAGQITISAADQTDKPIELGRPLTVTVTEEGKTAATSVPRNVTGQLPAPTDAQGGSRNGIGVVQVTVPQEVVASGKKVQLVDAHGAPVDGVAPVDISSTSVRFTRVPATALAADLYAQIVDPVNSAIASELVKVAVTKSLGEPTNLQAINSGKDNTPTITGTVPGVIPKGTIVEIRQGGNLIATAPVNSTTGEFEATGAPGAMTVYPASQVGEGAEGSAAKLLQVQAVPPADATSYRASGYGTVAAQQELPAPKVAAAEAKTDGSFIVGPITDASGAKLQADTVVIVSDGENTYEVAVDADGKVTVPTGKLAADAAALTVALKGVEAENTLDGLKSVPVTPIKQTEKPEITGAVKLHNGDVELSTNAAEGATVTVKVGDYSFEAVAQTDGKVVIPAAKQTGNEIAAGAKVTITAQDPGKTVSEVSKVATVTAQAVSAKPTVGQAVKTVAGPLKVGPIMQDGKKIPPGTSVTVTDPATNQQYTVVTTDDSGTVLVPVSSPVAQADEVQVSVTNPGKAPSDLSDEVSVLQQAASPTVDGAAKNDGGDLVVGPIKDDQGQVVPEGTKVTVVDPESGKSYEGKTDKNGEVTVPAGDKGKGVADAVVTGDKVNVIVQPEGQAPSAPAVATVKDQAGTPTVDEAVKTTAGDLVVGPIKDDKGQIVPVDTKVTVVDPATGESYEGVTDQDGNLTIPRADAVADADTVNVIVQPARQAPAAPVSLTVKQQAETPEISDATKAIDEKTGSVLVTVPPTAAAGDEIVITDNLGNKVGSYPVPPELPTSPVEVALTPQSGVLGTSVRAQLLPKNTTTKAPSAISSPLDFLTQSATPVVDGAAKTTDGELVVGPIKNADGQIVPQGTPVTVSDPVTGKSYAGVTDENGEVTVPAGADGNGVAAAKDNVVVSVTEPGKVASPGVEVQVKDQPAAPAVDGAVKQTDGDLVVGPIKDDQGQIVPEGTKVTIVDPESGKSYEGETDKNGEVTVPAGDKGNGVADAEKVNVIVQPEDQAPAAPSETVTVAPDTQPAAPAVDGAVKQTDGDLVVGPIKDDQGQVVPEGTKVTVVDPESGKSYEGKTDKNGQVTVPAGDKGNGVADAVVTGDKVNVIVQPEGQAPSAPAVATVKDQAGTPTVDEAVKTTAGDLVVGPIKDAEGNVLPKDTPVTVVDPVTGESYEGKTDENGEVTVPAGDKGNGVADADKVNVIVQPAGQAPSAASTDVPVKQQSATPTVDGAAKTDAGLVVGPIRDAQGNLVPEGTKVTVTDPATGKSFTGTTDKNGEVTVPAKDAVAAGNPTKVQVVVTEAGKVPSAPAEVTVQNQAATPTVGDAVKQTDGDLVVGPIKDDQDQVVPEGTKVTVVDPATGENFTGTTDKDGNVTVPAGEKGNNVADAPKVNVIVDNPTDDKAPAAPVAVETQPQAATPTNVGAVKGDDGKTTITGDSTAADGTPVTVKNAAGETVATGKVEGGKLVAADGSPLVVDGLQPDATVKVTVGEGNAESAAAETKVVDGTTPAPEKEAAPTELKAVNDPTTGATTITGESAAADGIPVTVKNAAGETVATGKVQGGKVVAADGTPLVVDGLQPGDKLAVTVGAGAATSEPAETTVQNPAATNITADRDLTSGKTTVTGDSTAADGTPVVVKNAAGETVATGKVEGGKVVAADGTPLIVDGLKVNDPVNVVIGTGDAASDPTTVKVTGETGTPVVENVVRNPDTGVVTIVGNVPGAGEGVTVTVVDPKTNEVIGTDETDADGNFEIVVPGDKAKDLTDISVRNGDRETTAEVPAAPDNPVVPSGDNTLKCVATSASIPGKVLGAILGIGLTVGILAWAKDNVVLPDAVGGLMRAVPSLQQLQAMLPTIPPMPGLPDLSFLVPLGIGIGLLALLGSSYSSCQNAE